MQAQRMQVQLFVCLFVCFEFHHERAHECLCASVKKIVCISPEPVIDSGACNAAQAISKRKCGISQIRLAPKSCSTSFPGPSVPMRCALQLTLYRHRRRVRGRAGRDLPARPAAALASDGSDGGGGGGGYGGGVKGVSEGE